VINAIIRNQIKVELLTVEEHIDVLTVVTAGLTECKEDQKDTVIKEKDINSLIVKVLDMLDEYSNKIRECTQDS
jgi:hypothetical protein